MNDTEEINSKRRSGFTLMEMLVVQGVIVGMVAASWPALRAPLGKSQLRGAAKQVRIDLAKARLKAIETGTAQRFRYRLGEGVYEIAPLASADALGGFAPLANGSFTGGDTSRSDSTGDDSAGDDVSGSHITERELADGLYFEAPVASDETAADDAFSSTPDYDDEDDRTSGSDIESNAPWSAPIIFYPNGRATNARIRLHGSDGFYVDVTLRGLTGAATVGDLGRKDDEQ